jgi:hypothetical protein
MSLWPRAQSIAAVDDTVTFPRDGLLDRAHNPGDRRSQIQHHPL